MIARIGALNHLFPAWLFNTFVKNMAVEKKAFVLRIQPETLKELERWAQEEFRSVNGQIEFLLNDALRKRKRRGTLSHEEPPTESNE